jgi:hypothetical protein
MNRVELIQKVIDHNRFTKYLEIGSYKGQSFFPIVCKSKVAIDPKFNIPIKRKVKWIYKNPHNIFNKYFELTSDRFFEEKKDFAKKYKAEIVFIDGLHTFKASLLDVLNSLKFLSKDGVIIMHDCFPPNKAGSTYANSLKEAIDMKLEGWTGEWTGDVWKTIVYLKEKYDDKIEVYVLDTDYGLGYVKVKSPIETFEIDTEIFNKINLLTYEDLTRDTSIINLKDKDYIENVL